MTHAEYHIYASLFDAAAALPHQFIRLHGEVAGEAFRAWARHRGITPRESTLERIEGERRVTWTLLEDPTVSSVGVHLDDDPPLIVPVASPGEVVETEPVPAQSDELEMPF